MTTSRATTLAASIATLASLATLTGCVTVVEPGKGDEPRFSTTAPIDPSTLPATGAIYQPSVALALFEDYKARRTGDILTVVLMEETNARKSADASSSRDASAQLLDPVIFGRPVTSDGVPILNTDVTGSQTFNGEGEAAQSNMLEGSITVTVAEVLPNGNLVVQGEKWIRINRGEEFLQLRGIVRPVDISTDNTVLSTQIADAELGYGGTGQVARASAQGWLSRFFGSVLWPL
jgi:flagellar L-ring protein precursor FlgH